MPNLLRDKVAIVTGSGRGVGRGVAHLMAQEGAKVVVVDPGVNVDGSGFDQSIAKQVVSEIREAGGAAVPCTESDSVQGTAAPPASRISETTCLAMDWSKPEPSTLTPGSTTTTLAPS